MIVELHPDEYSQVLPLCTGMTHHLTLLAMLEGKSPGRVYADARERPKAAFVASVEGYYLVGALPGGAFLDALGDELRRTIFVGETLRADEDAISLFVPDEGWVAAFDRIFKGREPFVAWRRHYRFAGRPAPEAGPLPPGHEVREVDAAFFNAPPQRNHERIREWVATNWGTPEAFLAGGGLATYLLVDGIIASWSVADSVSGRRIEVGIHTDPDFRRQGLAHATVSAIVRAALARGYTEVGWHCGEENVGSQRVAEGVGFELTQRFPAYLWLYDEVAHLAFGGYRAMQAGDAPEAIRWFDRAQALGTPPDWSFWYAARAWATVGDDARALALLQRAADAGWQHWEGVASEPAFARLRDAGALDAFRSSDE